MQEALRAWHGWLDDDAGAWATGSQHVENLGGMFGSLPSAAVARGAKAALDAAGQRLAQARTTAAKSAEQSAAVQQQAASWGEAVSRQEQALQAEVDNCKKQMQ